MRPDLRHLGTPRLSGAPLPGEIDYDDLRIHQTYRTYVPNAPGQVKYLMYELSQQDAGEEEYEYFWKAVRLTKITRVPRYLREATGSGPSLVIDQQRDLLAALREQGVLFLNVITKADDIPLLFCYGVQGVGASPAEAQAAADEGWAALIAQLDGLYQQLEYQNLTVAEGEALVRYQHEWDHLAMARGRPLPTGASLASASILDGNRTDVESTLNQLEAFLRGMSDRSFMLSLITVPVTSVEMTLAWRNVTQHLSQVRSEQQGMRAFTAGVAIPLSFGQSLGHAAGNTHAVGASHGVGATDTASQAHADTVSQAQSIGQTITHGQTEATSVGQSLAHGATHAQSVTDAAGHSLTQGQNLQQSVTHGLAAGESIGQSDTQSLAHGASVGQTDSLTHGITNAQNWGHNIGQSLNAGVSQQAGWNQGHTTAQDMHSSIGGSTGQSIGAGSSEGTSGSFHGGVVVVDGGTTATHGTNESVGLTAGNNVGASFGGSAGVTSGVSGQQGSSLTQGVSWGDSLGGSQAQSIAAASGVSRGESLVQTQAVGVNHQTSIQESLAAGTAYGLSHAEGFSQTRALAQSSGESLTTAQMASASRAQTVSQAQSLGQSTGVAQTASQGTAQALTQQQALSDAYTVAMSRSSGVTSTLGAIPSVGVTVSRQTFDEAKRMLGDVLEAQMHRYIQGIESGAYFYQMYLICPDRDTLLGAAALLKSAFWGPGTKAERLPQPFHTIADFEPEERERLLQHARAFTSYRAREPIAETIEPYRYSSFVTAYEAATFCHPPTAESLGLLAVHDSMPVMAMPSDRAGREVTIGHLVNGERGKVSDVKFGVDTDELTHTLIAGTTGSGKTTTLMSMLSELVNVEREIVVRPNPDEPIVEHRRAKAGVVGLDWMSNMRNLASIVEPERFRFYSIARPELGAFRWNPLAIPDDRMNPIEWANDIADQMTIAFTLGEFGRSLIAEFVAELYTANRLTDVELVPAGRDKSGQIIRPAFILPAVDRASLPPEAIRTNASGEEEATVLTYPGLSRLIGMEHLAGLVLAKVEHLGTTEGARLYGTAMRDRLQSLWRRIQYFAPGSMFAGVLSYDTDLMHRDTLSVEDLIDPDRGLVSIIEADGLDLTNRRFILGSVLLAIWRYGQFAGPGSFDHNGQGPGTYVCLEEAHELFGPQGEDEDNFSAATRTQLYESLFRRARALGMKLVAVVQNAGSLPEAVTSNTSTVFIHRQYSKADRDRVFSLLNWTNMIGQQQREYRYLGEMARGFGIARLDAKESYLESAPIHFRTQPAALSTVTDRQLAQLAKRNLH